MDFSSNLWDWPLACLFWPHDTQTRRRSESKQSFSLIMINHTFRPTQSQGCWPLFSPIVVFDESSMERVEGSVIIWRRLTLLDWSYVGIPRRLVEENSKNWWVFCVGMLTINCFSHSTMQKERRVGSLPLDFTREICDLNSLSERN